MTSIGLLALAVVGFAAMGGDGPTVVDGATGWSRRSSVEKLGEIPADRWVGAPKGGLSGADLRGSVVLMEFWTYLCYNCKNVEPWMKEAHTRYSGQGVKVIGVHTPEFDVERKFENVVKYMNENGIGYPVAIDNGFKVWRKYNKTNAWPAFLVFDREGKLVYRKSGERAVTGAGKAIEEALADPPVIGSARRQRLAVSLDVTSARESQGKGYLEVTLDPLPGFKVVKSPPAEIVLIGEGGVIPPADPVQLGEVFRGTDPRDIRYFDGPASLRIPLEFSAGKKSRDARVRGSVVYGVCDTATRTCSRQKAEFSELVEGS